MNNKQLETSDKTLARNMWHHVFFRGFIVLYLSAFLAMIVFIWVNHPQFGFPKNSEIVAKFIIWGIGGVVFGFFTWPSACEEYEKD